MFMEIKIQMDFDVYIMMGKEMKTGRSKKA